jgi:hypothetical protein
VLLYSRSFIAKGKGPKSALCSFCEQRAQLSSKGRAKKDLIGASCFAPFWFVEKRSPQRLRGAEKEYIFTFSPLLYP